MSNRDQWSWFVWGKHPGISDFVFAGTQTPLFQKFTKWVDNGFRKVDPELKKKSRHCSWRFWSKGAGGDVVCGLVRNSCDSYGRSFPLLCLGTGKLTDWSRNCSLLPFAFEAVWKHFEYTAAARYSCVGDLSGNLQLVHSPEPLWRQYQMRVYSASSLYRQGNYQTHTFGGHRLCEIDCEASENLPQDLCFCSNVVATSDNGAPTAVFIGEIASHIAVAMVDEMLKPADFAWLWSLPPDPTRISRISS
jgi:type VI secretion system ImpM family protein